MSIPDIRFLHLHVKRWQQIKYAAEHLLFCGTQREQTKRVLAETLALFEPERLSANFKTYRHFPGTVHVIGLSKQLQSKNQFPRQNTQGRIRCRHL
jgi:hypothetical protein